MIQHYNYPPTPILSRGGEGVRGNSPGAAPSAMVRNQLSPILQVREIK